jgi:oligopeptide/dipeptide ABC transporter ATP-binding protein
MKDHPLLWAAGLRIGFPQGADGTVWPVESADFRVGPERSVALVGESGCGKTLSAMALMGLLRPLHGGVRPRIEGQAGFRSPDGAAYDLTALDEEGFDRIRSAGLSMVFQEPFTCLNPVISVGVQIAEVLRVHLGAGRAEARERAAGLLDSVGIPDAARRARAFPHEFSGGQRQRIMIAMAIALDPAVLIADEPTTALDVSVQAQILTLLRDIRKRRGTSLLLITHNLGIVAQYAQDMVVMYAGYTVESGPVDEVFASPRHPYTRLLLASIPGMGGRKADRKLVAIEGVVPAPGLRPPGCPFWPRCPFFKDDCREAVPEAEEAGKDRRVRCRRWKKL